MRLVLSPVSTIGSCGPKRTGSHRITVACSRWRDAREGHASSAHLKPLSVGNDAEFLNDFAHGTGPGNRYYGEDDPQTQDMIRSSAFNSVLQRWIHKGCRNGAYGESTAQSIVDTVRDFPTNPTEFYVGGFTATFTDVGNGSVDVDLYNPASLGSLVGLSFIRENVSWMPGLPSLFDAQRQTTNPMVDLLSEITGVSNPQNNGTTIHEHFYFRCKK